MIVKHWTWKQPSMNLEGLQICSNMIISPTYHLKYRLHIKDDMLFLFEGRTSHRIKLLGKNMPFLLNFCKSIIRSNQVGFLNHRWVDIVLINVRTKLHRPGRSWKHNLKLHLIFMAEGNAIWAIAHWHFVRYILRRKFV